MDVLQGAGRDLARGKLAEPTLASVTAYADFLRFETLPFAGGTFEQPWRLLEEMRIVHSAYIHERERQENRAMRRAKAKR